jgi:hypothetical protein
LMAMDEAYRWRTEYSTYDLASGSFQDRDKSLSRAVSKTMFIPLREKA